MKIIKIINHKNLDRKAFPPRGNEPHEITTNMLSMVLESSPKYAVILEWPQDGSMPVFHHSTEDLPVLAYRLQQVLKEIYSMGENGNS